MGADLAYRPATTKSPSSTARRFHSVDKSMHSQRRNTPSNRSVLIDPLSHFSTQSRMRECLRISHSIFPRKIYKVRWKTWRAGREWITNVHWCVMIGSRGQVMHRRESSRKFFKENNLALITFISQHKLNKEISTKLMYILIYAFQRMLYLSKM